VPSKLTTEDVIRRFVDTHGTKYTYDKVVYQDIHTKVCINCSKHGIFQQTPNSHMWGYGCPKCGFEAMASKQRSTKCEFIEKATKIHKGKYGYDKVVYILSNNKVAITCSVHGDFYQTPSSHLRGNGCSKCASERMGKLRLLGTDEFISRSISKHGTKYSYDKVRYVDSKTQVIIICPTHGEFKQTPSDHMLGKKCSLCANILTSDKLRSSTAEFITKAKLVHSKRYIYDKVDYVSTHTKVIIVCRKHGEFKQSPAKHLSGRGCPTCVISHGENKVMKVLDALNIKYQRQYRIPNSRYRYDFYLPELDILIEYDGIQHTTPVKRFGGHPQLIVQRNIDYHKNLLASTIGAKLIRISYTKFNILEDYLLWRISRMYKYVMNGILYENFTKLCKAAKFSKNTTIADVKKYLLYNKS